MPALDRIAFAAHAGTAAHALNHRCCRNFGDRETSESLMREARVLSDLVTM